jgi:hypothetical protein
MRGDTMLDSLITILGRYLPAENVKVWAVFALCLIFSGTGVGLSFFVLGATITGYRLWGVGIVIAVTMLGISYGAKYANADARTSFTPLDLIQYLSQGFLWPSTWPALAQFTGVGTIEPPVQKGDLLLEMLRWMAA